MASHNSEHSGSMNLDEFSNLIGHKYAPPQLVLALPALNHHLFVDVVAQNSHWSPETARRIQEGMHLIFRWWFY